MLVKNKTLNKFNVLVCISPLSLCLSRACKVVPPHFLIMCPA